VTRSEKVASTFIIPASGIDRQQGGMLSLLLKLKALARFAAAKGSACEEESDQQ
jgi:hypothetical protein